MSCSVVVGGCKGGGSATQPSPTPSAPSITAITVSSSADLLLVGGTGTFTAVALYSDGSSVPLTSPSWTSDNPAVAKVNQTGLVEATGAGSTSIGAEAQGIRGVRSIRVVPRFTGTWRGRWQHLSCTSVNEPGDTFDWCNGIRIGDMSTLTLSLTQDRDTVRGSLNLSGVVMEVEGSIALDGTLSLGGNRPHATLGYDQSVKDWRSVIDGSRLDGTFLWSSVPPPPAAQRGRIISDRLSDVVRID